MTAKKKDVKEKGQTIVRHPLGSSLVNPDRRMQALFGDDVLEEKRLPTMASNNPHKIEVRTNEGIMIINSPLVGTLNGSDMNGDMFRNSLRLADVNKLDAVVITGNVTHLVTQGWGLRKPDRAIVSGIKITPERVEESYPKSVREMPGYEAVRSKLELGKIVFTAFREKIDTVVDMLHSVCTYDNDLRAFNGPILITLGKLESGLISYLTNELVRIDFFKERFKYEDLVQALKAELRSLRYAEDRIRAESIREKLRDLKLMLDVIIRMKNAADECLQVKRDLVASYIIKRYEEAIPGSKVISVGDAYVEYGGKKIMVTGAKRGETECHGGQGKELVKRLPGFLRGHKSEMVPDVIIGSGMNPVANGQLVTYHASSDPGDKKVTLVLQAPVCADSEKFRNVIRDNARLYDNVTKLADHGGFESGVTIIRWHPNFSLPRVESWFSPVLKDHKIFKNRRSIANMVFGKTPKHKMLYFHHGGCNHIGAADVWICESPNDKNGDYIRYLHQIAKEMMCACDAPLVGHYDNGDSQQGANHHYPRNGHPELLNPQQLKEAQMKIDKNPRLSKAEKLKQYKILAQRQAIRSGIYELDGQTEEYVDSIARYLDYWLMILRRAEKVGIRLTGTLACITKIIGNHCANTFRDLHFFRSDSRPVIDKMQLKIMYALIKKCQETKNVDDLKIADFIMKQMQSPSLGPLGEARGSLCIPGHPEWAFLMKHKQGSIEESNDNARKRATNETEVDRPCINLSGDNHRGGFLYSRGVWNFQTGCGQGEGTYGREINGSEQNVFAMNFGIPVGGPGCGPAVVMFIDQTTARAFAKNPFPIDRKILFKNSVE